MIYICADDYGITAAACKHIDECVLHGALNKISIFPNTELTDIKERIPKGLSAISIHINLVEGKPISPPEDVSLLVDSRGYFKYSFTGLFLLSLSSKRKELKKQIYREIRNQIEHWRNIMGADIPLEIDSHQHTNMIPVVFRVLMRVIKDEKISVKYIRFPAEPILPYLQAPSLYLTYNLLNLIKQWVLKIFGLVNRNELKKSGIKTALFMGVLFSGNMDEKRVTRVLNGYNKLARKNDEDIEILFHPGYIEPGEKVLDTNKKKFIEFYSSEGRKTEFNALKNIKVK